MLATEDGFGPTEKLEEIFASFDRRLFVGHTHLPCVITDKYEAFSSEDLDNEWTYPGTGKAIINVGSVGQPRDRNNKACFVTVDGDIVRMTSLSKPALPAWQFLASGSGFAVWSVQRTLPDLIEGPHRRWVGRGFTFAGAGALAIVAAIYAVSGTPARLAARFPHDTRGLDGLAYLDVATYREDAGTDDPEDDRELALADDRPLIEWLRENVEGSPVIVEAVGPLYHWTGRMARR